MRGVMTADRENAAALSYSHREHNCITPAMRKVTRRDCSVIANLSTPFAIPFSSPLIAAGNPRSTVSSGHRYVFEPDV